MTAVGTAPGGLGVELRPLLRLAGPVVMAELATMSMGLIDTMMVGRVSAEAIGGISVGGTMFFTVVVFGFGMLLGLDYTVAHAFGARRIEDAHRSLVHGVYLGAAMSAVMVVLLWAAAPQLHRLGIQPAVLAEAVPFLRAATWSVPPLLLFVALRRYLQAMNVVRPIMISLLTANAVHAGADWVLIFGHLGFPALGAEGAGWAAVVSRTYLLASLLGYTVYHARRHRTGLLGVSLALDTARMRELVALGFPAALQASFEVGVFAAATAMVGNLDPTALAAHHIVLSAASLTFMVPLGVSAAGAVRVGQAMGRHDVPAAGHAGWGAMLLGSGFMLCAGAAFVLAPRLILGVFTNQEAVVGPAVTLLFIAAVFQLFDGAQVVATGILRGTGDTRTPAISNLVGHWMLGLPVGYLLCFRAGWGVTGLWIGLSVGLIAVAVVLLAVWARRIRLLTDRFHAIEQPA